jgi:hypothetical protein
MSSQTEKKTNWNQPKDIIKFLVCTLSFWCMSIFKITSYLTYSYVGETPHVCIMSTVHISPSQKSNKRSMSMVGTITRDTKREG